MGAFAIGFSRAVRAFSFSVAAVALTAALAPAAAQTQPHRLQISGSSYAEGGFWPVAIDSHRRVAGKIGESTAAVKRGDRIRDLGPGETSAINNAGVIVGYSANDDGRAQATMWLANGRRVLLDAGRAVYSKAVGINDLGEVVGARSLGGGSPSTATYWHRGRWRDLGVEGTAVGINSLGVIVGQGPHDNTYLGFVLQNGTVTWLGSDFSYAAAVNDAGQVVGSDLWVSSARLWQQGQTVDLGVGYYTSTAADINQGGEIVGFQWAAGSDHAFAVIWRKTADGTYAAIDLNTLLRPEAVAAGWILVAATGINDRGDIIGAAFNPIHFGNNGNYGFVLTDSPLPDEYPTPAPPPP